MVAEALPLLCCIYSSCWPFKSGWWLGYTQENSTTYLNSFNWSATHKLTKSILTICTTSYSSSRSKASDLEVKRWSQQNHIHLQRTEPLMSPKLRLWSNEFRSQGPASLTYGSPEGQVKECFYDLIRSIIFCPVFMTRELVSTFLERESFEVQNIFHLHMIKKSSHKRNVHVCTYIHQVHFFRLRSHEKLKFPSEKKIGRKKKNLGGNIIFIFLFFCEFLSTHFLTRKKHKNVMCESDWKKKKKNHKIIIKTHFPHEWNWKKFQEKKNCFFCLEKKSGQ